MKERISTKEITEVWKSLRSMPILAIEQLPDEERFVIGIGKWFCCKTVENVRNVWEISQREVPQYALFVYGGIEITWPVGSQYKIDRETSEEHLVEAASKLIGHRIEQVVLLQENDLEIRLDHYVLRMKCDDSAKKKWQLQQPKTEEPIFSASSTELFRISKRLRKWSKEYSDHRDRWIALADVTGQHDLSEIVDQTITAREALSFMRGLLGLPLMKAAKSPDTDLYEFGFWWDVSKESDASTSKSYFLHGMTSLQLTGESQMVQKCFGDTIPEEFHAKIQEFMRKRVTRIDIVGNNELYLELEDYKILLRPSDCRQEAWRFFEQDDTECHLSASYDQMGFS